MASRQFFTNKTFAFLKDLEANNTRDWFKANQERYEEYVRGPALEFIAAFATPLQKISDNLVADPRKAGGSLFRINRDTRFSKDKSPYKTSVGIQFRHEDGKDAHCPGLYLHIQRGECFCAAGIWHPDSPTLGKIRDAISGRSADWKKAAHGAAFRKSFDLAGESLKRPPRGYDAEHPFVEDLKRKDFMGVAKLAQKDITSATLVADLAKSYKASTPLLRFLCEAVGVPF